MFWGGCSGALPICVVLLVVVGEGKGNSRVSGTWRRWGQMALLGAHRPHHYQGRAPDQQR